MKVTFVTGRAGSSLLILTGVTAEVSESSKVKSSKVKSAEVKSSKVTVATIRIISIVTAGRASVTIFIGTGSTVFAFMHNLLVSLLDFFEFGFCLIFVRVIDICIRVIFSA